MRRGLPRGHFSRSRSLEQFNEKFWKQAVEKEIEKRKKVKLLEIGCGEGRALMELCKKYPGADLHGINKKPWAAMKGTQSLPACAKHYGIMTVKELRERDLPKIHFYDAERLKFKDEHFDIVISQVAIQYVRRKDLLLEEVWRVLNKGRIALLSVDASLEKMPDFMQQELPRFVVYDQGKEVKLSKLLKGYDIKMHKSKDGKKARHNIVMRKNTKKKLRLGLELDELSSFDLSLLNKERDIDSPYWAYRSVVRKR